MSNNVKYTDSKFQASCRVLQDEIEKLKQRISDLDAKLEYEQFSNKEQQQRVSKKQGNISLQIL